jgi:hypothetical protein
MSENNGSLFRFMSFYSFVDLVQTQSLTLVRPALWEDPYEGFIFQKLKSEAGKNEIIEILNKYPDNPIKGFFIDIALKFEKTFYAQAWTICPESDALWRIYNFEDKAIRVEVLENKMRQIPGLDILYVQYDDEIDVRKEIERIGLPINQTLFSEVYRVKRAAFSHEKEVRIIYQLKDAINETSPEEQVLIKNAFRGTPYEKVLNEKPRFISYPNIYKASFSRVPQFIKSVMLHPQSPNWFNITLEQYCQENNLNYLGKSKLYKSLN